MDARATRTDTVADPQGQGQEATVGSLFSGIGGFELGFEWAGFDVRWQVENDRFCNGVLAHHWPTVRRYGDVRLVDGRDLEPVEWIVGGFPCQDLSPAGTRTGLAGARSGLARDAIRIIAQRGPAGVVLENSGHAWRSWVPILRRALWQLGYAALPLHVRASDFGAWHERHRVYLVAHVDPRIVRLESWRRRWPFREDTPLFADAASTGLQDPEGCGAVRGQHRYGSAGPDDGEARDAADLDGEWQLQPCGYDAEVWRRVGHGAGWPAEPGLDRVVHGVPFRAYGRWLSDRIAAQGNAVLPPITYWVASTIRDISVSLRDAHA